MTFKSEQTMQDFGNDKIEQVDSEEKLLEAIEKTTSYDQLKELVDSYNSLYDESYRKGRPADPDMETIYARDPVIARVQFDDCDAYIIQRNRITELRKRDKMKVGDTVTVHRDSGAVERDWKIDSIDSDDVTVRKANLTKTFKYPALLKINTESSY